MNLDNLKKYKYNLPENLIRKTPLSKRDDAKLLIYNTKTDEICHDYFFNLHKYLPQGSNLILNNTTVKPVRLNCLTEHKGKVEVFLLLNEWTGEDDIPIMTNKSLKDDNFKKYTLLDNQMNITDIIITVYKKDNKYFLLNQFMKDNYCNNINFDDFLNKFGIMPIPHYLEDKVNSDKSVDNNLKERYNTVFAYTGSSVAAPTASLHFTQEVFEKLESKNIKKYFLTLDVGRGTFANLKEDNFINKKLHQERFFIDQNTKTILDNKEAIKVVVGTTACRSVETYGVSNNVFGVTDIFITPGFDFKCTDILITNFHLPETSLMLLVDAFLQHKKSTKNIMDFYRIAIENKYSFYSFGDSMIII